MTLTTRSFEFDTVAMDRASQRQAALVQPRWMREAVFIIIAAAIVWFGLCAIAPDIGMVFGPPTPAVIGIGAAVVCFALVIQRGKHIRRAYAASAFRAGKWQIAITDDGLQVKGDAAQSLFAWHGLTEVREDPFGLLVMSGALGHVPIPANAFTNTTERDAFRRELEARIAAAKGAL